MPTGAWLKNIFASGVTEAAERIGAVVNDFAENHTGKKERDIKVMQILAEQGNAQIELVMSELDVRSKVMIAELTQDDKWTKRARPMIIYTGLVGAILEGFATLPFTDIVFRLSPDFWKGWTIAVGIYALGRSAEKLGSSGGIGKIAEWVTGNKKKRKSLLEE